jgi:4-amino-4-deoxy-L-arabinose transferase-like glycosyltransferase
MFYVRGASPVVRFQSQGEQGMESPREDGNEGAPTSWRVVVFCLLLLAIVASLCNFVRLSEGSLFGDEAAFAFTTDRMRQTGDWIVPYIGDEPHLNATPLYNWLTLTTGAEFAEGPFGYRIWSSVFGVGCVLLTFVLGTLLFRPAVGLLAALFLAFNRDFLFCHGVRFGGMDALLAFFITAATICYAWLHGKPGQKWLAWGLVGLFIGLAGMSKPPVFAGFFLGALGLHHLGTRRDPWHLRLAGPFLALGVCLVVAGPWYFLMWSRLGLPGLHQLFVHNSVERALDPAHRDYLCSYKAIMHASNGFKFVPLALGCGFACWLAGVRRPQWGLVLFLGGSYVLALSSAGKCGQYTFYAFPILAVILAGLFLESGSWLVNRFWSGARAVAFTATALGVCLVGADGLKTVFTLTQPGWVYPPLGVYRQFVPGIERGDCHFVLFDFARASKGQANFEDLYYCPHLQRADRVESVAELRLLLADHKPAIVVLPSNSSSASRAQIAELHPELWIEEGSLEAYRYPILAFQGALTHVSVPELIRLARANQ